MTVRRWQQDQRVSKVGAPRLAALLLLALGAATEVVAQGFGLYKDGQLVEQLGTPLDLSNLPQAPPSTAVNPQARPGAKLKERAAQVRRAEPSAETATRNKAALRCAKVEGELRNLLRAMKSGAAPDGALGSLRAISFELAAAQAGLQASLSQAHSRILQSGFDSKTADRPNEAAIVIDRNYQNVARAIERILAGEAGAIGEAAALVEAMAPPAAPDLAGRPPTVLSQIEQAPTMEREDADKALAQMRSASPNAISASSPPTAADLAATIEVQLTPEIISKAAALGNSPLAIYEFVRNNVRFQPYLGSRKGAVETLRQLHGNDTDQASLLLALLRASNIPCRYVRGTVEMTPERARSWLGVDHAQTAGSILTTAGLDGLNIVNGPNVVAIRCTRVWVEAYLPYSNYRGVPNESTGKTWVPLDPTFTLSNIVAGQDVLTPMGFNVDAFLADYISTFHVPSPVEKFVADVQTYLNTAQPGTTVAQVERTFSNAAQTLGLLPASLPYQVRAINSRFSELEDNKRYKVRFRLYNGGTGFIDYTINLSQIAGQQVTIDYVGATPADQAIIDANGGIFETPPNLVSLKARLKLNGTPLVTSPNAIGMGLTHSSDLHFLHPSGASNVQPLIQNTIIAGNTQAIAFDTFLDTGDSVFGSGNAGLTLLESELHSTAAGYLGRVDRGQEQVQRLMRMVSTQDVSEAIVESSVSVGFSFGTPVSFEWTGLIVDADRRIVGPFAVDGNASKHVPYMFLTGYDGSTMENRIFEDTYEQEAVSTIKILELASDAGIPVFRIITSIAADAPGLSQPASVVNAINAALAQGHHVIVPRNGMTIGNWSGTGYIDLNPNTGAAGYIISGGISGAVSGNGGATVETWPINLGCKVKTLSGYVVNPPMDTPDLPAIFVPDATPFTFVIEVTVVCDDGTPTGQPQPPFRKTLTTTQTKQQILDSFGPGNYTLSLPAYPGFIPRQFTLVKLIVEIYKPAVVDSAQPMIPEADRLGKGGTTIVNLDNDDADTKFDNVDDAVAGGDDELVKVRLTIQPKTLGAGLVRLMVPSGSGSVKLWKQNDKATANSYNGATFAVPADLTVDGDKLVKELWVEGISPHTAARSTILEGEYAAGPRNTKDKAALTVVGIEKIEWEGKQNSRADTNVLDADPNWPGGLAAAASRVFPDARMEGFFFPAPGSARDKVTVRATLSVAPPDPLKLCFKSFDVDDPTDNLAPVDDDAAATGLAEDNRGTAPAKAGKIVGSDANGVLELIFSAINNTFEFQTTLSPGDNFRIVGTGDVNFLAGLENNETALGGVNADKQRIVDKKVTGTFVDREVREAAKYVSPALVVWRFLHVEKDSMRAMTATENIVTTKFTNFTGTSAAVTQLGGSTVTLGDLSNDLDSAPVENGRFENGQLIIAPGASALTINPITANGQTRVTFPAAAIVPLPFTAKDNDFALGSTMSGTVTTIVKGATTYTYTLSISAHSETPIDWPDFVGGTINVGGGDPVTITAVNAGASTVTAASLNIAAEVRDDDNRSILPKVGDLAHLITVLEQTYMVVLDDGGGNASNNQQNSGFLANLPGTSAATDEVSFQRQAGGTDNFWVGYLLMSYQMETSSDNDPNLTATGGESGTGGVVWGFTSNTAVAKGGQGTQVFVETVRDRLAAGALAGLEQRVTAHEFGHQMGLNHWDTGEPGVPGAPGSNLMLRTMQSTPNASAMLAPAHKHLIRSRVKSPGQ